MRLTRLAIALLLIVALAGLARVVSATSAATSRSIPISTNR